jgi:two-component system sensor histidine kinase BaeS
VADISHELRTPLALLRGELEALQDGIRPLSLETVDSLFGDLMRLNRLTDDLYQLSLSDLGALSYRKVQLDPLEILAEDLAALASEFDSHRLRVDFINRQPGPVSIHADEDRLSQLYRNLLKNSINYTDSGGRLEISAFQQADQLVIVFADSAPGVAEAEIPHLFDRFYRVEHSRNRHHGGAGLGLAICSNIVQAHGGTIQAKKSALGGLAIHIQLPINS